MEYQSTELNIRPLTLKEAEEVYRQNIHKHFPPDEVKPLKNIGRMWEYRKYFAYGGFDSRGELMGYAFLCDASSSDFALLDYFAVKEEYRGKGVGGTFLQKIAGTLEGYVGILIETEAVCAARNEQQAQTRIARNRFYERNDAIPTGVGTVTFGVVYDIWCLPIMETVYDKQDIRESLDAIYSVMIDDEEVKKVKFRFL